MSRAELGNGIEEWVNAGLITEEQAQAIRDHESTAHRDEPAGWVEPVAYLGGALVAVALFLFSVQIWDQLAEWGRIALSSVVTVVLLSVGYVLRGSESAPARRAASFTWFLAVGGVAATMGLISADTLELDSDLTPFITAAVATIVAAGLYLASRTTMQQLAIAWTLAFLVLSTIPLLPSGEEAWIVGLLFLAVGVIWMLFALAGFITPPTAAWVVGSLFAAGVGVGAFDDNALWSGLGILVGLGLIWLSIRLDRRSLLGLGVLALVIWIPTTVTILFEESIAVPVAILVTGFATLTAVATAVRLGRRSPSREIEEEADSTQGGSGESE